MKFKSIRTGINQAHEKAPIVVKELTDLKLIVFSDHHRGIYDSADDFKSCEQTYLQALIYYYEQGYTLLLLGDVEEFWENEPKNVLQQYLAVQALEREFHLQNRLIRIWGNHDDIWQFKDKTKELLQPTFPDIQPLEAIEFNIQNQGDSIGKILFLHGHQGTLLSSRFAGFSKLLVRYLWRPVQRVFKVTTPTPSNHKALEAITDKALDFWASMRNRQLIVAGHTHSALFGSFALVDSNDKPCYFNTGCCSFNNGDITGLDFSSKEIKLVKWMNRSKEPIIRQRDSLESIFNRCDDAHW